MNAQTAARARTPARADIARQTIGTIRTLAIDAVEKVQSDHAGAPTTRFGFRGHVELPVKLGPP